MAGIYQPAARLHVDVELLNGSLTRLTRWIMRISTLNRRLHVPPRTRRIPEAELADPSRFDKDASWRRLKDLWHVPTIWPDSTIYLIGGGASVKHMPLGLIKGRNVIGANSAFRLGDWVKLTFFGDGRWFDFEQDILKSYGGILVTTQVRLNKRHDIDVKRVAKGRKGQGISTKKTEISWNNSSGGALINLAYHLGGRRLILIGYDMKAVDGKHNFHDHYPWNVDRPQRNPYRHFLRAFPRIAADARTLGVLILNATPDSAIDVFPFVDLEEAVKREDELYS